MTIDVAIIGAGGAGKRIHADKLLTMPEHFRLVGFCDTSAEYAKQAAAEYGVTAYHDTGQLLAESSAELVVIATRPHSTHASLAVQCLEAGRHVVVEKPMCITSEEARQMIAARDTAGRVLSIHHNRRWDIDFLNVAQVVREGLLGELRLIKSIYLGSYEPGDSLYEWGSHLLDQCLRLAGGLPQEVSGVLAHPHNEWETQGYVSAWLRYAGGLVVEMSLLPVAVPHTFPRFYLAGTEGSFTQHWTQRPEDLVGKQIAAQDRKSVV